MSVKKKPSNKDLLALAIDTYTAAKVSELVDPRKAQPPKAVAGSVGVEAGGSSLKPESSYLLLFLLGYCLAWLFYLALKGSVVPVVLPDEDLQSTFLSSAFSWLAYLVGVCNKALANCATPNVPLGLALIVVPLALLKTFRNGDIRIFLASTLAFGVLGSYLVAGKIHPLVALGVILSAWVVVVTIAFVALYVVYVLLVADSK